METQIARGKPLLLNENSCQSINSKNTTINFKTEFGKKYFLSCGEIILKGYAFLYYSQYKAISLLY